MSLALIAFAACAPHEEARLPVPPAPPVTESGSTVGTPATPAPERREVEGAAAGRVGAGTAEPAPVADSPRWPSETKKMRLTWVLYPVVMRSGVPVRKVELVVRAGAVAARLATSVVGTVGNGWQPDCDRASDAAVRSAELFLNGGGNETLRATWSGGELRLVEETGSDGLCEPAPCPVTAKLIGRMTVPVDAVFEERFHEVDGPGSEHDLPCVH